MNKKKINKTDIVNNLVKRVGFSSNYSKKITDDLINIIISNIRSGNLNIKNLGSFSIINTKERIGRNPKTKKEYIIKASKTVRFILSKKILEHINS